MTKKIIIPILVFFMLISIGFAITEQEAINALDNARQDIIEMHALNIPVISVNDSLHEAEQAFERAQFADLIKNNATGELAKTAKKALEGLEYSGFSYEDVIYYTEEISYKKEQSTRIIDSFKIIEQKILDYKNQNIDTSDAEELLLVAKIEFDKERFNEVDEKIQNIHSLLEEKKAEQTKFNVLVKSSKSFIQKNWKELIILLVIILVITGIALKKYKKKILKNKLKRLYAEEKALMKLIKKTQKDRFHKEKLSRYIYHIRIEKYTKRLNEVRENIPVIKGMIDKKN